MKYAFVFPGQGSQAIGMGKDFYENFVIGDSGFSGVPQLILVCEDEKHMAETFKEIVVRYVWHLE